MFTKKRKRASDLGGLMLGGDRSGTAVSWNFGTNAVLRGGLIVGRDQADRIRLAAKIVKWVSGLGFADVCFADRDGNHGTEALYFDELERIAGLHDALQARVDEGRGNWRGYEPAVWNTVLFVEHAARLLTDPIAGQQLRDLAVHGPDHGFAVVMLIGGRREAMHLVYRDLAAANMVYLDAPGPHFLTQFGGDAGRFERDRPHALVDGDWTPYTPYEWSAR